MSWFGDLATIGGLGAAGLATGGIINPGTAALLMGGTGLLAAKDKANEQKDTMQKNAQAAAAQTQFSPYTKMGAGSFQATPVESSLGGAMQGAVSGLALSQNYNAADKQGKLMEAQTNYFKNAQPAIPAGNQQDMVNLYAPRKNPYQSVFPSLSYGG